MPSLLPAALGFAAACAAATLVAAQPRPDPLDPAAPVAAQRHASSLGQHRAPADPPPVPWKAANDTAARVGGWRAYAREANAATPPAPAPAAAASATTAK